jgi:hypothetical protein
MKRDVVERVPGVVEYREPAHRGLAWRLAGAPQGHWLAWRLAGVRHDSSPGFVAVVDRAAAPEQASYVPAIAIRS